MTIQEMHVWFRQYAQQMGMQNVRAILPEQIDLLINTSINDTINQLIRENVGLTNDRVVTDNSKLGQINALRYLYKVQDVELASTDNYYCLYDITFNVETGKRLALFYFELIVNGETEQIGTDGVPEQPITDETAFGTTDSYETIKDAFATIGVDVTSYNIRTSGGQPSGFNIKLGIKKTPSGSGITNFNIYASATNYESSFDYGKGAVFAVRPDNSGMTRTDDINIGSGTILLNNTSYVAPTIVPIYNDADYYNGKLQIPISLINKALYYVDFSIQYKSASRGLLTNAAPIYTDTFNSNLFPVRLIDDSYLADTLNDFVLSPRFRSPIVVIYNNLFEFYLGKLKGDSTTGYFVEDKLAPYKIRISYISSPNKVFYGEDAGLSNVNSDLPEYMHVDILKHAVDMYRESVSGGLQTQRNNDNANQQENLRNNYRNEGYQQQ